MKTSIGSDNATGRVAVRESTLNAISDFAYGLRATNDAAILYLIEVALRLAGQQDPLIAGRLLKGDFEKYIREVKSREGRESL